MNNEHKVPRHSVTFCNIIYIVEMFYQIILLFLFLKVFQ